MNSMCRWRAENISKRKTCAAENAVAMLLALFLSGTACTVFRGQDISPNRPGAEVQGGATTAGLIAELAGDDDALYAVTLNAGVWKSVGSGTWNQMVNGPRWAASIAIDPANPDHLVVGERNGEATPVELNRSGVWESNDAGVTWNLIFSALSQPGCRARGTAAIASVFFSPARTLFIGTPCGVGRRALGASTFDFAFTPRGVTAVEAFAVSAMRRYEHDPLLWARAVLEDGRATVLSSERDGMGWQSTPIPTTLDGYGIGPSLRGDNYTIAAFGETAILSFRPTAATDSKLWTDADNFNTLLYFFRDTGTFKVQSFGASSRDGTGLGGRKRLRSYTFDYKQPLAIGSAVQVYYIGGQDLLQATGLGSDGTLVWAQLAQAQSANPLHPDFWDVHLTKTGRKLRLATDGGVFRSNNREWLTQNDGLHTHHVHDLVALSTSNPHRLAYVTSDNSEWARPDNEFSDPFNAEAWFTYSRTGDGTFVLGDVGNPAAALISRNADITFFTDFGRGMPKGAGLTPGEGFRAICAAGPEPKACQGSIAPSMFQIVQTLASEKPAELLDAVMLTPGPVTALSRGTVQPVQGVLGSTRSSTSSPLLLRNRQWLKSPDVNRSQYQGWEVVATDVPNGASGLWVSGGHAATVYYVLTVDGHSTALWRHDTGIPGWTRLEGIGMPIQPPRGAAGPVFVNPFDPDHVVVLTTDGVRIAQNVGRIGATTPFQLDRVLTALISESGRYALNRISSPCKDAIHCTQAFDRPLLGSVAFNRARPSETLAASPVGGVFLATGAERAWLTFGNQLPRPSSATSAVALDGSTAYVGFEGRGVWRFTALTAAPLACYFESIASGPDTFVALHDSTGAAVASVAVEVILAKDGVEGASTATTGSAGELVIPGAAGKVVHLRYAGGKPSTTKRALGPCATSMKR